MSPAPVVLPQSESSDSASTSTSSSRCSSLHKYGSSAVDTTSTSTSTAALETGGGKAAGRKRRHSDTTYPRRRKRSSSTDTEVAAETQSRGSKFWLYSLVAIVLTIATASAISVSLHAADAETDEPSEYVLPKQATTRTPQCSCANGSATNAANPGAVAVPRGRRRRRLTTSEPRRQRTSTRSPDGVAAGAPNETGTFAPDKPAAAVGSGNASAVQRLDGADAVPEDSAPREVARKVTRSLVAYKIGPGRRKHGAEASTASRTPPKNHTGTRAPREVQRRAKQGQPNPATKATDERPTVKHAAGTNEETATSKTAAYAKPGVEEVADWEQEMKLVDRHGPTPSAAKKRGVGEASGEDGASNAAAQNAAATAAA